eukprot:288748-Alexandrium_andersonii.AAC.1
MCCPVAARMPSGANSLRAFAQEHLRKRASLGFLLFPVLLGGLLPAPGPLRSLPAEAPVAIG